VWQASAVAASRGNRDLARRFFSAAAKPIGLAWQLATGGDLAIPGVEGRRSRSTPFINLYVDRVLAAAESDALLTERFLLVINFLDPPASLLTPAVMFRVATINCRWRRSRLRQRLTGGEGSNAGGTESPRILGWMWSPNGRRVLGP
jgi:hypothetical protein